MVKKGEVSVPKKEKTSVKKTSVKETNIDFNFDIEPKKEVEKEPISFKPKKINKKYISFNTRFIMSFLVFLILLSTALLLIITSLSKINEQSINYQEKSNVVYEVLLKDKSLYDKTYFVDKDKPRIYISSLMGNINANFNYSFNINEESNIDFTYYIVGKLVILNSDGSKMFYNKEYELSEKKHLILINQNNINIAQNVSIDYGYYNNIANQFRQQYGINTLSYLELSLVVNGHELDNVFDLDSSYSRGIRIPLSEHEVDIQVDDDKVSNVSKTISKNKLLVSNKIYITIGFVSLIVAVICFVKIVNNVLMVVIPKKSKYDKYVNKILKEYDRLIVNTVTAPDLVSYKITKIGSFTELLDVRDNLRLPIKYYIVTEHQKSIFYITHRDEIYIFIVKAVDIENN